MVPTLKILDGERFDQAFLHRKQKRQVLLKKRAFKEHQGVTPAAPVLPGAEMGKDSLTEPEPKLRKRGHFDAEERVTEEKMESKSPIAKNPRVERKQNAGSSAGETGEPPRKRSKPEVQENRETPKKAVEKETFLIPLGEEPERKSTPKHGGHTANKGPRPVSKGKQAQVQGKGNPPARPSASKPQETPKKESRAAKDPPQARTGVVEVVEAKQPKA